MAAPQIALPVQHLEDDSCSAGFSSDSEGFVTVSYHKRESQVPIPKYSNHKFKHPSTRSQKTIGRGDLKLSIIPGRIILAPHVYINPDRDATGKIGPINTLASYWPAIVLEQFYGTYLCVPIHSFNGQGASKKPAEVKKELLYLTLDGKPTPALIDDGVEAARVLGVTGIFEDHYELGFNPREGAAVQVTSHFDVPVHHTYEVLGSITVDSLATLIEFYRKVHGPLGNNPAMEYELRQSTKNLDRLTRQTAARGEQLSTANEQLGLETKKNTELTAQVSSLQSKMRRLETDSKQAKEAVKSNGELTERNQELIKQCRTLEKAINVMTRDYATQERSWSKTKAALEANVKSQKAKLEEHEKALTSDRAAREGLEAIIELDMERIATLEQLNEAQKKVLQEDARTIERRNKELSTAKACIKAVQNMQSSNETIKGLQETQIAHTQREVDLQEWLIQSLEDKVSRREETIETLKKTNTKLQIVHLAQLENLKSMLEEMQAIMRTERAELQEAKAKYEKAAAALEGDFQSDERTTFWQGFKAMLLR